MVVGHVCPQNIIRNYCNRVGENFKVSVSLSGVGTFLRFRTPAKQMPLEFALQKSPGLGHHQCCLVVLVPVT